MRYLLVLMFVVTSILPIGYIVVNTQAGEKFEARLSIVPVDAVTARTISGSGSVEAVLMDNTLFIAGVFEGVSSPSVAAHIHVAAKGLRGPVAFNLSISENATGALRGRLELNETQINELRDGRYYVQVHTERNPDGEIRGWLLKEEF